VLGQIEGWWLGACVSRGEGQFDAGVAKVDYELFEWIPKIWHCSFRLKWGVGRLINESPKLPIVIPLWHIGMDDLLPNTPPYIPQPGKKILLNIGQPINLADTMDYVKSSKFDEITARKFITDKIQDELFVSFKQKRFVIFY
jgi:hypothetical protein